MMICSRKQKTHLDPAVVEIIYFKHDVGASPIIVFIGNPDVDIIRDVVLVWWTKQQRLIKPSGLRYCDKTSRLPIRRRYVLFEVDISGNTRPGRIVSTALKNDYLISDIPIDFASIIV